MGYDISLFKRITLFVSFIMVKHINDWAPDRLVVSSKINFDWRNDQNLIKPVTGDRLDWSLCTFQSIHEVGKGTLLAKENTNSYLKGLLAP